MSKKKTTPANFKMRIVKSAQSVRGVSGYVAPVSLDGKHAFIFMEKITDLRKVIKEIEPDYPWGQKTVREVTILPIEDATLEPLH